MKKVSLHDIAQSLNVSTALVSFVLNNHGDEKGINAGTQRKVIAKAKELNYIPNHIARGLRLGRSQTIGLIVADISNKFYAKIAKRIEDVAGEHGYNVMFCSSDENPEKEIKLIEMLRERQVDGLIISTTQKNSAYLAGLKKEHFPFVLIDRQHYKIKTHYVGVDNYQGAYTATELLIRNGFTNIALLKISPSYLSSVKERESGYKDALRANGIHINNKLIREIGHKDINQQVSRELAELLLPPYQINALFTVNNNIAVAALEYLNAMNIQVPKQIGIISFDDIELFRLSNPPIAAVAQPVSDIGEEAVNILLRSIEGKLNGEQIKKILPVQLIQRQSCEGGNLH